MRVAPTAIDSAAAGATAKVALATLAIERQAKEENHCCRNVLDECMGVPLLLCSRVRLKCRRTATLSSVVFHCAYTLEYEPGHSTATPLRQKRCWKLVKYSLQIRA